MSDLSPLGDQKRTSLLRPSPIPRQLSPDDLVCLGWLAAGRCCGLPLPVVQCPQHPDPRMHDEVTSFGGTDQAGDGGLPSFMVLLGHIRLQPTSAWIHRSRWGHARLGSIDIRK
jgi:hypothetical protein